MRRGEGLSLEVDNDCWRCRVETVNFKRSPHFTAETINLSDKSVLHFEVLQKCFTIRHLM